MDKVAKRYTLHHVCCLLGHSELLAIYAEFICVSFSDSRIVSTGNVVIIAFSHLTRLGVRKST